MSRSFRPIQRLSQYCTLVSANVAREPRMEAIRHKIQEIERTQTNIQNLPFVDHHERKHTYLRISLTEKCNLRCLYCMPEEGVPLTPNAELLTSDEIIRLVQIFASHGIDKVRLTGGEPSIRRDLVEIIERINAIDGIKNIGMTSNGITLKKHLKELKAAGLTKINISLDTLDQHKFTFMTRRNGFKRVMETIDEAESIFPKVKINTVVMNKMNETEVVDFVELTQKRRLDVRFIEYMPFGGNEFSTKKFVDYKTMLKMITEKYGDKVIRLKDSANDTTKAYKIDGGVGQFGFITSMSEHFCSTCNRLRITADGNLKVCLHGNKETSMRDLMREGMSDDSISEMIQQAVSRKKKQHAVYRHGESSAYAKSSNDSYWRINKSRTQPLSLQTNNLLHLFPLPSSTLSKRTYSSSSKTSLLLTHVAPDGSARQVDVSRKQATYRIAIAEAEIKMTPEIIEQIETNNNKKGDVLNVARVASVMASKQTSNLIPLCHNIPISFVDTRFRIDKATSTIYLETTAKTNSNTGIEMEALTACSIAALTVYDMCKAMSHEIVISNIRLIRKDGGKSSYYVNGAFNNA